MEETWQTKDQRLQISRTEPDVPGHLSCFELTGPSTTSSDETRLHGIQKLRRVMVGQRSARGLADMPIAPAAWQEDLRTRLATALLQPTSAGELYALFWYRRLAAGLPGDQELSSACRIVMARFISVSMLSS